MKMRQWMKQGLLLLLTLCLCLTLLTGCGGAPAGDDSGSDLPPASSEESTEGSNEEGESSLMLGDLYVLNNMDVYNWNIPMDLSEASTEEEAVLYAAIRSGLPYSADEIQSGDPREWEGQNSLLYYIYDYIFYVMVDEEFHIIVDYGVREQDNAFLFTRETITGVMERIFGIPDYQVDGTSWNGEEDRYIIIFTNGKRDMKHEIQLAGEVEWVNQNKYTLSVYCYETTDLKKVVVEDWYRRIDLTLERDQKEVHNFYLTGIDIAVK